MDHDSECRFGSDPKQKPATRRNLLILALAIGAVFSVLLREAPTETQAEAMTRCEKLGALSYDHDHPLGMKALSPDDPAVRRHGLDLSRLPQGYSTLPDGEGVFVTEGCAFVEPTGVRNADGTVTPISTDN